MTRVDEVTSITAERDPGHPISTGFYRVTVEVVMRAPSLAEAMSVVAGRLTEPDDA